MGQGFFESDDDYRARTAREANEQTIKDASGSAPSQGFFESNSDYATRLSREANEHRVESASGTRPSQGFFESDDKYQSRIEREANEHSVAAAAGRRPTQGFFEGDDAYAVRVRKEANEGAVTDATGRKPTQGFFEGDHAYRARVAHEAREARVRSGTKRAEPTSAGARHSTSTSSQSDTSTAPPKRDSAGSAFGGLAAIGLALVALYYLMSPATAPPPQQPAPVARPMQSPAPKATRVAPAAPIDWQSPPRLTLKAFGPIRVGMSFDELLMAGAGPLHRDAMQEDSCFFVSPSRAPPGMSLMISNGRLARIDITSSAFTSLSGARVGQAQQTVIDMYRGRLEVQEHKYDDNGKYLLFRPNDTADQGYMMIFETNGQSVTRFRAGLLPEVAYVEGCL